MLCKKCSNIHFKRIEDCEPIQRDPSRLYRGEGSIDISGCVFYFHHNSREELHASAENGCHFCEMLYRHLFELLAHSGKHDYPFANGEVILRRSVIDNWIQKDIGFREWNDSDWIYINCEDKKATTTSMRGYEGEIRAMLAAVTLCADVDGSCEAPTTASAQRSVVASSGVQADSDVLMASMSPQLYSPWLDTSTISPANLALASLWLKNCRENHQPCIDGQVLGELPTRIINISNPREPRLEDGLGRTDQYVTLSYAWGTRRRYVTNKANLSAHRAILPLAQLPMTFKDAMYVTYMLGFKWLWIDALCIIQDSEEDQAREMSVMDNIFRCSTLTLFAAAGRSVEAGLAVTRDPRWNKPCLLTLKTTLDGQTVEGSSYISIDSVRPSEPLNTRGWVLQEEILALRGLIFGSRELVWRCLCGNARESHPTCKGKVITLKELGSKSSDKKRRYDGGFDGFDLLRMWIMRRDPVPDRTHWQRDIHFDHWYRMVTNFSNRKLTFPSDVLPALSGLASAMAKMHHCNYLAGLWAEDLQVGLAWYVEDARVDRFHKAVLPENDGDESDQPEWTPLWPSWSWISHKGSRVKFRGWENNHILVKGEGVTLATAQQNYQEFGSNPFAHVVTQSLTLTGRVKIAIIDTASTDPWRYECSSERIDDEGALFHRKLRDLISGEVIGLIAFDEEPRKDFPSRLLYCLLCTVREKYGKYQLTCLGLLPTDLTLEEFTRIGLVFVHDQKWFGEFDVLNSVRGETRKRKDATLVRTIRVV